MHASSQETGTDCTAAADTNVSKMKPYDIFSPFPFYHQKPGAAQSHDPTKKPITNTVASKPTDDTMVSK